MKVNRSTAGALAAAGAAILAERYAPVVLPFVGMLKEEEGIRDNIASQRQTLKDSNGTRYDMVRVTIFAGFDNRDSGEFVKIGVTAALEAAGVKATTIAPYAGTIGKAVDWLEEVRGDDEELSLRKAQVQKLDMNGLRAAMKGSEYLLLEETLKTLAKRAKYGAQTDMDDVMEVLQHTLGLLPELPVKTKKGA